MVNGRPLAAWVTTSSEGLKARCASYNSQVEVFWPAWNRAEPLWERPASPHAELRVGWIGTAAEREDFMAIKREVVRFLREMFLSSMATRFVRYRRANHSTSAPASQISPFSSRNCRWLGMRAGSH